VRSHRPLSLVPSPLPCIAMSGAYVEHSTVDVKLDRADRVYRPGESVSGSLLVIAKDGWTHTGVQLSVLGQAKLQLSARSVGLFESMSNLKPLVLLEKNIQVLPPGKVPNGLTSAAFEFQLPEKGLFESYHGVYINVSFTITATVNRSAMKKSLTRTIEFIVEVPKVPKLEPDPEPFNITPESLENVNASTIANIPTFTITGKLFHKQCPINLPFTGELNIQVKPYYWACYSVFFSLHRCVYRCFTVAPGVGRHREVD